MCGSYCNDGAEKGDFIRNYKWELFCGEHLACFYFLSFFKKVYLFRKEELQRKTEKQKGKREESSLFRLAPSMAAMTRVQARLKLAAFSTSPVWYRGPSTQVILSCFPRCVSGSWIKNGGGRTRTITLIWDAEVSSGS